MLQQVQDAIAGGGIAAGQTKAPELMAVHYDPGSLSEANLTAWECRVVALQHLGQHADAAEGFSAVAGAQASVFGENDSRAIRWRNDSGSQFALLGRYDQAEADHRCVLALAAKARPRQHRIQLRLSATRGLIFVHNMRGALECCPGLRREQAPRHRACAHPRARLAGGTQ